MANLEELIANVRKDGYSEINAEARVCQDIVRSITGNVRRAT